MGSKTPVPTFPRMSDDLTGKFHVCSLKQTFYVYVLVAEGWHNVHQKTFSGYAHDVLHVFFGSCGFLFWHRPVIQHTDCHKLTAKEWWPFYCNVAESLRGKVNNSSIAWLSHDWAQLKSRMSHHPRHSGPKISPQQSLEDTHSHP